MRYSARDLAVWRAHQLQIPVVLGSATPSLESWQHAQSGRYRQLELRDRAVRDAVLPKVRLIDMERDKPAEGLTSILVGALKQRLERGEQSLLFLNRRGYAPVLACDACGWVSDCRRCTAFMVLHKPERRLRCHHCSLELPIPRHCPTCGNVDLQPLGRGTQRLEESLQIQFPEARLLRIDADSTRRKGSAQAAFEQVHRGEVDILIGTQMVAKGHDFKNLTLVGVLNPDTALFSHDYRASERLFAQLMQVAGRAGRAAQKEGGSPSEVLIQSRYPQHPLYAAVMAHDYDHFAAALLGRAPFRRPAALHPPGAAARRGARTADRARFPAAGQGLPAAPGHHPARPDPDDADAGGQRRARATAARMRVAAGAAGVPETVDGGVARDEEPRQMVAGSRSGRYLTARVAPCRAWGEIPVKACAVRPALPGVPVCHGGGLTQRKSRPAHAWYSPREILEFKAGKASLRLPRCRGLCINQQASCRP